MLEDLGSGKSVTWWFPTQNSVHRACVGLNYMLGGKEETSGGISHADGLIPFYPSHWPLVKSGGYEVMEPSNLPQPSGYLEI